MIILKEHEFLKRDGDAGPVNIVLRYNEGAVQPFCTHVECGRGNYFWGHYFETLEDAMEDHAKRVNEYRNERYVTSHIVHAALFIAEGVFSVRHL